MTHREQLARSLPVRVSVSLACAAGLILGLQGSATAVGSTVTAVQGNAFGYKATGISLFGGAQGDTGPTPNVTLATDASNSPQSGSAASGVVAYGPATLFTSDAIAVQTAGSLGTTGAATSTSSISNINKSLAQPSATGGEIFTADNLSGSVTADGSGVSGSTSVTGGIVDVHSNSGNCTSLSAVCGGHTHVADDTSTPLDESLGQVAIPANPPARYIVEGHVHLCDSGPNCTDYYVIAFNEPVTNSDGSLTVDPVHEYFGHHAVANPSGAYVDATGAHFDIVEMPPYSAGGPILHGHLHLGQVTAGVTALSTPEANLAVSVAGPGSLPVSTRRAPSSGTYTFTVRNDGPDVANNVALALSTPGSKTTFASIHPSAGTCSTTGGKTKVTSCNLGSIGANTSATVEVVINAPTKPGSITINGTATTGSNDPDSSNNTASMTVTFFKP